MNESQHSEMAVFLGGILSPAAVRFGPLLEVLKGGADDHETAAVRPVTKELEVFRGPGSGYTITAEVAAVGKFLDANRVGACHLYGYSAGASVALAYAAAHPERVLSLALDEPASDFSDDDRKAIERDLPPPAELEALPVPQRMALFVRSLVHPDVSPPAPAPGGSPTGPAALVAMHGALAGHELDRAALERFDRPVLFTYGGLSNPRWEAMSRRAAALFPRCQVQRADEFHHLWPTHQGDPGRVARWLYELWSKAGAENASDTS